jgi:hypothetical protein
VESIMIDPMFEVPSNKVDKFVVTADFALKQLQNANFEAVSFSEAK